MILVTRYQSSIQKVLRSLFIDRDLKNNLDVHQFIFRMEATLLIELIRTYRTNSAECEICFA